MERKNKMEYLLSREEMQAYEEHIIKKKGVSSLVLMERAALSVLDFLLSSDFDLRKVLIVCGPGNNGGDGLALARLLFLKGINIELIYLGEGQNTSKENSAQLKIIKSYAIPLTHEMDPSNATLIVDAIFGIGLSRSVEGKYHKIIEKINESRLDVVSLDIPSGIDASTGQCLGIAIRANTTVTFAYKKLGCVLYPGANYTGNLLVKDIGISHEAENLPPPSVYSYTQSDLIKLPQRLPDSNKGTYGKVLIIAGDLGMSGAAYLAAKAAYKVGAGLVKILTHKENRPVLLGMLPEAIISVYEQEYFNQKELIQELSWATSILVGPGMGVSLHTEKVVETVIKFSKLPVILDADALNVLAKNRDLLKNHGGNLITTPHLQEMSRLIHKDTQVVKRNLIEEARKFALKHQLICVLKDSRSVVSDGGPQVYLNQSGNSGMATAGSGDVLAGMIAGLCGQNQNLFDSAKLGVYLHGLAGDAAKLDRGETSLMASDILDSIHKLTK